MAHVKPTAWDGSWSKFDDWLLSWDLYKETGLQGMETRMRTVMFINLMPKKYSEFLSLNQLRYRWTESEMIAWLNEQRSLTEPQHLREATWKKLRPEGGTFQHLTTWFQKWAHQIPDLKVTEEQVLDQFDIGVRRHFGTAHTEVLKTEQELKAKEGKDARLTLEQRYNLLVKEVIIQDQIRALNEANSFSGASFSGSHYSGSSTGSYRKFSLREVDVKKSGSDQCHFCKKPGHWKSRCAELKKYNQKMGSCLWCGRSGHFAKECPKKKDRRSGSSNDSRSSGVSRKSGASPVKFKPSREVQVQKRVDRRPRSSTPRQVRGRSRSPGTHRKSKTSTEKPQNKVKVTEVSAEKQNPEEDPVNNTDVQL